MDEWTSEMIEILAQNQPHQWQFITNEIGGKYDSIYCFFVLFLTRKTEQVFQNHQSVVTEDGHKLFNFKSEREALLLTRQQYFTDSQFTHDEFQAMKENNNTAPLQQVNFETSMAEINSRTQISIRKKQKKKRKDTWLFYQQSMHIFFRV